MHPIVRHAARAVNPITTGSEAKARPVDTVVALAVVLVALNTWKSQATPDLSKVGKDALFVIGLVAVGTFAPELVTGVLWVALLLWVLMNEPAIADMIGRISSQVPGA